MLVCGCDVGSTTGKALLLKDGEVAGYSIVPCTNQPERTASLAIEQCSQGGLDLAVMPEYRLHRWDGLRQGQPDLR